MITAKSCVCNFEQSFLKILDVFLKICDVEKVVLYLQAMHQKNKKKKELLYCLLFELFELLYLCKMGDAT